MTDFTDEPDEESCAEGCYGCPFPQTFDTLKIKPAYHERTDDETYVKKHLDVPEIMMRPPGDGKHQAFTRDDGRLACKFQHDANGHDEASDDAHDHLFVPEMRYQGMRKPHAQIYKEAEYKDTGELEKMFDFKQLAQDGDLTHQHKSVDEESSHAHADTEHFGDNIGKTGDGGCAEAGIGDDGNAVPHEKKSEKKNKPTFPRKRLQKHSRI